MIALDWTRALSLILSVAVAAAVGAACLPDNGYERFQNASNTSNAGLKLTYERIDFDPTPIDVAIVGPSRTMMGLSQTRLEAQLARRGKPVHVANLSIIGDGRNLQWVVADELFRRRSPRVLVLPVFEDHYRVGHPVFRLVAPAPAIALPPAPFLYAAPGDLMYLPFRQLGLFAARAVPALFGMTERFDAAAYARTPQDMTFSHRAWSGRWIEMSRPMTAAALRAEQAVEDHDWRQKLPKRLVSMLSDDETVYVGKIIALARAHGSRIVFVFLPHFEGADVVPDRGFYEQFGPIVSVADLRDDSTMFQGWNHLNHRGAMIASDRVATAVAAAL